MELRWERSVCLSTCPHIYSLITRSVMYASVRFTSHGDCIAPNQNSPSEKAQSRRSRLQPQQLQELYRLRAARQTKRAFITDDDGSSMLTHEGTKRTKTDRTNSSWEEAYIAFILYNSPTTWHRRKHGRCLCPKTKCPDVVEAANCRFGTRLRAI